MKERTKSVICLVSLVICLVTLAVGTDVGSEGWVTASILGLFITCVYGLWLMC